MNRLEIILAVVGALVAGLVPLYALCYVVYMTIGLPIRRQERARLFLDLIATGLQQGRSVEHTVVSISHSQDVSVGVRFHLLAAYLEGGWSLIPALEKVAGLVPKQIIAMLRVGQEIGDIRRVLPACRTLLRDACSHVQSAYNYMVVLAFVLIPFIPALFWMMAVFIIPKYQQIFSDMLEDETLPSASQVLPMLPFKLAAMLAQVQIVIALAFYLGAIFYIGGPRLLGWLGAGLSWAKFDALLYAIPWRRKRMQRDFAAMLGLLLDAGLPEERAVTLAAETTANATFRQRAERVVLRLRSGERLPEAIGQFDQTGEFCWRLTNALHSGKNFFAALSGWLESLDAQAFRQQQTFAQLVTTGMVLYNGAMVSLFAIFVFRGFTLIIERGVLW